MDLVENANPNIRLVCHEKSTPLSMHYHCTIACLVLNQHHCTMVVGVVHWAIGCWTDSSVALPRLLLSAAVWGGTNSAPSLAFSLAVQTSVGVSTNMTIALLRVFHIHTAAVRPRIISTECFAQRLSGARGQRGAPSCQRQ